MFLDILGYTRAILTRLISLLFRLKNLNNFIKSGCVKDKIL